MEEKDLKNAGMLVRLQFLFSPGYSINFFTLRTFLGVQHMLSVKRTTIRMVTR